ncbi:archaetidylserine decarboxylase [Haliea sp. E1-2-M8]|uniref:archaetidylserine decarboxylase n=1 Tax=Haliea sp. E1-2-M8 TaxID=3064706 RepID=UPI00271888CC|nr:archaetidylserine decarboxylase [Haliea sp. E1-2-M8]MDO8863599.1 archaetidylserine decarboxylase [Haliea sp. E1-2-M8]
MNQLIRQLSQQEQLNFLLTNRIPRRLATQFMGWFSRIESPLLTRVAIALWRLFADDLNLEEAKTRRFTSLQACFTRELKPGARTVDTHPDIVTSPCDAIVGARGRIMGTTLFQAKGFPYELADLIPDRELQEQYRDGVFVTLRLKSSMYHRFHAPVNCTLEQVTYIAGDTWNVNPIALKRVARLYCKNERAVLPLQTERPDSAVCLVPVAAILVASIKLHCLDTALDLHYRGPQRINCKASVRKGDELGYFQHGSTIILFATGNHLFCPDTETGSRVQMGQALLQRDTAGEHSQSTQDTASPPEILS